MIGANHATRLAAEQERLQREAVSLRRQIREAREGEKRRAEAQQRKLARERDRG